MGRIVLVLGGIKSGKSRFASNWAESAGGTVAYIATASPSDNEMKRRIQRHRADRSQNWHTIEEPLHAGRALKQLEDGYDTVIVDCMTLLMTNWLIELQEGDEDLSKIDLIEEVFTSRTDLLLGVADGMAGDTVIVSNLVENGLISTYTFARVFQDLAGIVHQQIASRASLVVEMVAGIPVVIKGRMKN